MGGTLAGNALSAAAIRATLDQVLTAEAFERMIELAGSFTEGVRRVIDENELPWHIVQLGARAEYGFLPEPPTSGGQAAASSDPELEEYLHLFCLNRGVLITPFHNMALMSPATERGRTWTATPRSSPRPASFWLRPDAGYCGRCTIVTS